MKIIFHGAARSVTGSMHLVETSSQRLLLDCGLFQGHRAEAFERNSQLPFDPKTITLAFLSHAHLDHCGNLPILVRRGFKGEINCTHATRDLVMLMLRDSARIQEQDAQYMNQKKSRKGQPAITPLYTVADAEQVMPHLVSRPYDHWFNLNGGGRVMMLDAGHILGSAITIFELTDQGRTIRLGFTGDLGRPGAAILNDPSVARDLDYLIIESTYGDREHGEVSRSENALASVVRDTVQRGGKVIIPAFAVERTQEVVYCLHREAEAGRVPNIAAFVDSPLATNATDIFRMHLECLRAELREHLISQHDPFGFGKLRYTRSVEESKQINQLDGSAIIISASGMCEAGRVLHHLKNNIEDEHNTIAFVGYQAENTLGRRIKDGAKKVKIFGDEYNVRAQIRKLDGFSAHADKSELLDWVKNANQNPDGTFRLKGVFIVHGEEQSSLAFADSLRALGDFNVTVPQLNQAIEL